MKIIRVLASLLLVCSLFIGTGMMLASGDEAAADPGRGNGHAHGHAHAPGQTKTIRVPGKNKTIRVPGPTKTVYRQSSPKPAVTKTIRVPGHERTIKVPGPERTIKVPGPERTVKVPGPTETVTASPRQTTSQRDTVVAEEPQEAAITLPKIELTPVGAVGMGLLTTLAIVLLLVIGMWLGYYMGFKDSDKKETKFLKSLLGD